jgi:hypothetical protein
VCAREISLTLASSNAARSPLAIGGAIDTDSFANWRS